MTKQANKRAKSAPASEVKAETSSALTDDIFNESLKFIRDEIRAIADGKSSSKKHDPASRIAYLAGHASKVAAEQRKAEAAEQASLRKLSRALVIAWLRQCDKNERAQVIREATAIDNEGSVLS